MKKIAYLASVAILATFSLSSCEDFLDSFPQTSMTDKNFWKTTDDAEKVLVNLYTATLPRDFCWEESMSDNAYLCWEWWGGQQQVANGSATVYGDVASGKWSGAYSSIRKCWFLLEGLEKIPSITEADKSRIKGQVYFMLAYNYYILTSFFGDVPLVTKAMVIPESEQLTRQSRTEVVRYAIDRLDDAIPMLEGLDLENGRVTAGACRALKARIQLFNGQYAECLETIKGLEGKYQLYTEGETPYEDLFSGASEENCEMILTIPCAPSVGGIANAHSGNGGMLLKGMSGNDPYTAMYPTGALIDAYPMADGRLIHENGSNYDAKNPYVNRDPRFYQSIVYPTANLKTLDSATGTIVEKYYDPEDERTHPAQRYNASEPSRTGYMWNKYIDYSPYAMNEIWDCTNDVVLFRYAEVLLMKAESLVRTQGVGAKTEICNIVDQLRNRVKGGLVHRENYNTEDELMALVKNERRIELANEGLRYLDIIRWRDAEKNPVTDGVGLNGNLYGAYMRLDGIGKDDRTVDVDGTARRFVEVRRFDASKNYLFPIPQGERDLNPNLSQNPGWE
ncbi:RagB/SusD family nutrient uptake outer membrane protein [Bacteroides fluxus]|uniref:RagB/SusD family nutrient uptake outer membrane protein n=1 Tax=Bacteroides fluxus TaxID=626930 RepID=UPI0023A80CFA|nr:RagB/SusD family nutrient uptake outer membrane protein [Bacteroides fluxus]